jgi:hypothetical protein
LGLKIKDFNEYQLVHAARLFELAKVENDSIFYESVSNSKNIVIDGIGRDSNIILNQRKYLENFGYNTFMIMLYVDLNNEAAIKLYTSIGFINNNYNLLYRIQSD